MKWDIDKAFTALEKSAISGTSIYRVLVNVQDRDFMERHSLKVRPGRTEVIAWCVALGQLNCHHIEFYGWTIREAFLRARRVMKQMPARELEAYGVALPKKSNSYAVARRKNKK